MIPTLCTVEGCVQDSANTTAQLPFPLAYFFLVKREHASLMYHYKIARLSIGGTHLV